MADPVVVAPAALVVAALVAVVLVVVAGVRTRSSDDVGR